MYICVYKQLNLLKKPRMESTVSAVVCVDAVSAAAAASAAASSDSRMWKVLPHCERCCAGACFFLLPVVTVKKISISISDSIDAASAAS